MITTYARGKRISVPMGETACRKEKGDRGFTAMELVIILALMAVVVAIAMPSYRRVELKANLRSAARDIQGRIAYLREKAMADNTRYTLTFDKANNRYRSSDMKEDEWKYASSFGQDIRISSVAFGGGSAVTLETRGTLAVVGNIVLANGPDSTATIRCNLAGRTYAEFQMK
jgi:Tfp pilus assembly protein FimT